MENVQSQPNRRPRTPEVVKSAVRVLEILEFFDRWQQPATVGVIASDLGYPQSSSSALMRSLVKVGYLTYDSRNRTFMPTPRVPLLGKWASDSFVADGPLLEIARTVAERSGCAVGIGRRNFDNVQWMYAISSETLQPRDVFTLDCNLINSAIGACMLASLDDKQVRSVMHRMNAGADELDEVIPPAEMLARVAVIRRDGYALNRVDRIDMLAMSTMLGGADDCIAIALLDDTGTLAAELTGILDTVRETLATLDRRGSSGTVPLRPANRVDTSGRLVSTLPEAVAAMA